MTLSGPLSGSPRGDNLLGALLRRIERLEAQLASSPGARTMPPSRQVIMALAGSCTAGMAVRVVDGACTVDPANWYGLQGPDCGVIETVRAGVATVVTAGPYAGPVATGASCAGIDGTVAAPGSTWAQRAWLGRRQVLDPPGDGTTTTPRWVVPWDAPSPRIAGDWTMELSTGPRAGQAWRYWDETGLTSPATHTDADIPAARRIGILVGTVADPVAGVTYEVVLWSGVMRLNDPPVAGTPVSSETRYAHPSTAHALAGPPSGATPGTALACLSGYTGGGSEWAILHDSDGRGRHLLGRAIDPTAPTADGQVYLWSIASAKWVLGTAASDWGDITGIPATFPPSAHGHGWGDLSGVPTSFPPDAHGHALGGDASGDVSSITVNRIKGKPVDETGLVTSGTLGVQMMFFTNASDSIVYSAQIGAGANGAQGAVLTAYKTGATSFQIGEVDPVAAGETGYLLGIDTDLSATNAKPKWLREVILGKGPGAASATKGRQRVVLDTSGSYVDIGEGKVRVISRNAASEFTALEVDLTTSGKATLTINGEPGLARPDLKLDDLGTVIEDVAFRNTVSTWNTSTSSYSQGITWDIPYDDGGGVTRTLKVRNGIVIGY